MSDLAPDTAAEAPAFAVPTVGETLLVAVVDLEPGRVASLLPAPLQPLPEGGDKAFVYVVWATLNSAFFPVRGRSFVEANIALPCTGPAGEGTWFLRAYFPWKDLVRHAYLSGWTGVEAQVEVGRVPWAVQRFVWPLEHPIGGWVARGGRREIELAITPGADVALSDTPLRQFYRVYGVRGAAGRGDVTLERHIEDVMVRVCEAGADLRLAGDAAEVLGPHTVSGGYLIEFGIVHGGSEAVG